MSFLKLFRIFSILLVCLIKLNDVRKKILLENYFDSKNILGYLKLYSEILLKLRKCKKLSLNETMPVLFTQTTQIIIIK